MHSLAFSGAHISRRAHSRFAELMRASIMPLFSLRPKHRLFQSNRRFAQPPESRPAASISAHINRISSRAPRTAAPFFTASKRRLFHRTAARISSRRLDKRAYQSYIQPHPENCRDVFHRTPKRRLFHRAAARISSRRFDKRAYQSHIQPRPENCRAVFYRAPKRRIFRSNRRLNPIPNQLPQNSAFGRGAQKIRPDEPSGFLHSNAFEIRSR